MKQGIILYKSKYGAAKKYADWLRESTGFDCMEIRKTSPDTAAQYHTLILCGGIYASGIAGLSFLKKNFSRLQDKNIFIFCVGASPCDAKALNEIRERNLTGELKSLPLFYGRGIWDENRMSFTDRTLCRLLKKSIAKKDPADYEPWMHALMEADGRSCDWTDRTSLVPLLKCL